MCLADNDYAKYSLKRLLREVETLNEHWFRKKGQIHSYQRSTFLKTGCFKANKHSYSIKKGVGGKGNK